MKAFEVIKIGHLKYEVYYAPAKNFGVYSLKIFSDAEERWITQDFTNENAYRKFILEDLQRRVKSVTAIDVSKIISKMVEGHERQ